ncbi:hypothetical protein [Sulfurimonas sp. C5]|uniref:hypothetical protein n=1 Tax=Sulfurimonas sp. C5 TaxID=3036947 RepID=UPI0024539F55|nr:hypothetical protein [Sulfurimonas sp. C5]MDH4943716.1 hypothetical protein [Sulfurimonas sp. C5]
MNEKIRENLEAIRDKVSKTDLLDESQKTDSVKRIEEWVLEDKAFGTLKDELIETSVFFEKLFAELGIE